MHEEQFQAMRQSIIDGDAEQADELATQALALGMDPLAAINQGYVPSLDYTGELFSKGQAFLPELVMAGEAMKGSVAVLEPEMQKRGTQREMLAKIVIGTVKGDIHEIGKTLVSTLLTASGF
jgi:methanogenic corrinoid protein MtbC1